MCMAYGEDDLTSFVYSVEIGRAAYEEEQEIVDQRDTLDRLSENERSIYML